MRYKNNLSNKELEKRRVYSWKKYNKTLRLSVIEKYGNKCKCCGEKREIFLTLEHTRKDGAKHRKRTKGHVYADLKRRGFPKNLGLIILCWNCQWDSRMRSICPHKDKNEKI